MFAWLKSLGQDFQRGFVTYIIVAAGLGAWLLAKLKVIGPVAYDLVNRRINICLALSLCALAYLIGRIIGKSKWKPKTEEIKIIQNELVEIGPLKWNVTLYSNGRFKVDPVPYCKNHGMKLVENWPLYFCPVDSYCASISKTNLPVEQKRAISIMESHLRKNSETNI